MKKWLTIFMAFLLLTGATELHQLLRIPLLIAHFQQHRSAAPDITFFEYLRIHYASGVHPNDRDDQEDNQLPFRSMGTLQHTDLLFAGKKEIVPSSPEFLLHLALHRHPEGHPIHLSFSIFHPPDRLSTPFFCYCNN